MIAINMFIMDRIVEYKGISYRVLEELNSNALLVVTEADYEKGEYPLSTYVIPND